MPSLPDELSLWSAPFGLKLLECVDYKPGLTALDIGCGAGFPLLELAMRLGKTSTVYGIDPNKEALAIAESKAALFGITNIVLIEGMAEELPFGDQTIDLIVSNNGINNVSDISRVLSECARVMRPSGQFVISLNLDKTFTEFYTVLEKVLEARQMHHEISLMHRHIYEKRRPPDEITALLKESGFLVRSLHHDEFWFTFTDATAMFGHHLIRTSFLPSWAELLPAEKADEILSIVESRLNEQARQLGQLTLSVPFVVINAERNL